MTADGKRFHYQISVLIVITKRKRTRAAYRENFETCPGTTEFVTRVYIVIHERVCTPASVRVRAIAIEPNPTYPACLSRRPALVRQLRRLMLSYFPYRTRGPSSGFLYSYFEIFFFSIVFSNSRTE